MPRDVLYCRDWWSTPQVNCMRSTFYGQASRPLSQAFRLADYSSSRWTFSRFHRRALYTVKPGVSTQVGNKIHGPTFGVIWTWGPRLGPEPPAREDEEMDALLDKIMAAGLDSLTPRERRRLEELRQQRRAR